MELSEEQRALLQLLLEGGQGYDDIGSLLGIGSEQARARAREALTEVGGADPDTQVQLSDFLLGQADPIGRADAVRYLQADPEANALASRLLAQLRLLAPRAELPEIPAPKGGRSPRKPTQAPTADQAVADTAPAPGGVRGFRASKRQSQLLVGAGALALLLLVGALAIAGVFGGSDGEEGSDDGATTTAASGGADGAGQAVVRMAPLDGASGATGRAVLAATQDQAIMQLNLSGLKPTTADEIYVVWLYANGSVAYPIAIDRVDQSGNLRGGTQLGAEVIALLPQFGCLDLSLASKAAMNRSLQRAANGVGLVSHAGETVLRGQIPTAAGETAPSGADSECDLAGQGGGQGAEGQGGG